MLKIKQLLIDLYDCKVDLDNEEFLLATLKSASQKVEARIIKYVVQRFSPVGISAILILAETHISIHTWPEYGYAALDIFFCGEGKDPYEAWGFLKKHLNPQSFEIKELTRVIGEKHK